ncbi:MAG: hypothetical protein DYG89_00325 [Caldilinea sp. CFX5]|nr:hypothetical protein [Caldilinea sp. CFX5]
MERLRFSECTLTLLDRRFGVRRELSNPLMECWLQTPADLTELERANLKALQELLLLNVEGWNEQELSLQCIGPLLWMVRFMEFYRFNLFAQRHISAVIDDVELNGEPDTIIATGYREPEIPLFAFTEYKRQTDPQGDPAGQTLAAMLAAQALNNNQQPVYGCYVIGSDWRFMLLDDKHYLISRDYSALSDEIYDILRILKALRAIIVGLTAPVH